MYIHYLFSHEMCTSESNKIGSKIRQASKLPVRKKLRKEMLDTKRINNLG